ncbi:LytTR family transcriptional regulator DNA-binding domain-containing protein [Spirosoma fluminis]
MNTVMISSYQKPVDLATILYVAGDDNYTWFYLTDGSRRLSSRTLSYYDKSLVGFIRIHKRFSVNRTHVVCFERTGPDTAAVSMRDTTVLPVAKRRIKSTQVLLRQRPSELLTETVS